MKENMIVRERNIIREPLVKCDRVILPPLDIKVGLIKANESS